MVDIESCLVESCDWIDDSVVVTLVAKLAELSSAAANSFKVSKASGAELITCPILVWTICLG